MSEVASVPGTVTALRGGLVYFKDDPFFVDASAAFVHEADGLVVCRDGKIDAVGAYTDLKGSVPEGVAVTHYEDCLMCAGFIDTHIHYVQTGIIGAFGAQLIDWLNHYTFVAEQEFSDPAHAAAMAKVFCDELLRNGTTTALVFCAVYPQSVDALFEESERRGMRMIAGKVMMDRNAPDKLLDTAETSYDDSKALIERWHGTRRSLYAITPRFAPTSTPEQLEAAGTLWQRAPGRLRPQPPLREPRRDRVGEGAVPRPGRLPRRLRPLPARRPTRGVGARRAPHGRGVGALPRDRDVDLALPDLEPLPRQRPVQDRRGEGCEAAGPRRAGHGHRRGHQLLAARHDERGLQGGRVAPDADAAP